MRAPRIALIMALILLITFIPPVLAITDYGEDEDYLGQVVDDYENNNNVSAATNVINNVTLDCMELNYTLVSGYENFTEYIKVGADAGKVAVTDTRLTWTSLRRDDQVYLYKDFGVNYFDGIFSFDFDIKLSDVEAGDASNRAFIDLLVLDNVVGTIPGQGANKIIVRLKQNGAIDDQWIFRLGVGINVDDIGIWNVGTDYYCTLSRNVGEDIRLKIYSDSDRLNLISNIGSFTSSTDFRYLLTVVSTENVADGADHSSGYIENLDTGVLSGGYGDGHYYTIEMLDGDTGLVFMSNSSIPEDTSITIEFSDDNSTWVDHNGAGDSDTLISGFESLDLRDLNTTSLYMRFNMTTTDSAKTPRIYQLRLVTITDVVTGDNIPAIDVISFNTTIAEAGCEVYGKFSDVEGLSGYIFWNNATSAPGGVNSSFTALAGTSDYGYENITLPNSGTRMGVKYYVNDTDNNWAVDTLVIFPTVPLAICDPEWLAGWSYRVKITIDSGDVDLSLTDFPVLIYLSTSSGIESDDVSYVFDEVGANSLKIAVTTSNGLTECYVEVEKWDLGNEKAWLWAKIPSISNIIDTEIYLYYDNGHADNTDKVGPTNSVPAENVWDSDYLMVQHQAGASSPILDSTDNDIDMTETGDPTYQQVGPIDGEIDYDGNDYHLSAIDIFDAIFGADKGTIGLWIKTTASDATTRVVFSIEGAYVFVFKYGEGGLLKTFWSGTHTDSARTTTQINTGAQFYVVSTYDGTNQRVYVNGVLEATDACNLYNITALTRVSGIAASWDGGNPIDANIDDVRVSKINRLPSWIEASYETGQDHFLDFASASTSRDTYIGGGLMGVIMICLCIMVPIVALVLKRR